MGHTDLFTPPRSTSPSVHHDSVLDDSRGQSALRLIGSTRFEPLKNVKSILVTGGAGFIGGWMTRHLVVRYPEYRIVCFDKLDAVASLNNVDCLKNFPNFHFVQGDLINQEAVTAVISDFEIDCVIHFAAHSHVQNSFDNPTSFTLNNVMATQRLLDAVRQRKGQIRRFVHVSTDEVYGDAVHDFVREDQQFMPTNPYAASKAAAEMYVWAYAKSFDIPTIVIRSNNVYGPAQYPEKIIPRFFVLLSQQQPLTIQGSGLNVRRYLYAADAVNGFDTILHKGVEGEAYNLMSKYAVTNLEVAVRMLNLWGYSPQDDFSSRLIWIADRPFNDHDYRVDGSKIETLGWKQLTPFSQGLETTLKWYQSNFFAWWPHVVDKVGVKSTIVTKVQSSTYTDGDGTVALRDGIPTSLTLKAELSSLTA